MSICLEAWSSCHYLFFTLYVHIPNMGTSGLFLYFPSLFAFCEKCYYCYLNSGNMYFQAAAWSCSWDLHSSHYIYAGLQVWPSIVFLYLANPGSVCWSLTFFSPFLVEWLPFGVWYAPDCWACLFPEGADVQSCAYHSLTFTEFNSYFRC